MFRIIRIVFSLFFIAFSIYGILSLRPYRVSGDSMFPTLEAGNIALSDKIISKIYPLNRGEIIVFREGGETIKIKRIIGLPGETLKISEGKVYRFTSDRKEVLIEESYLGENIRTCVPGACTDLSSHIYTIPDDHYFVLGDNRLNSRDSRGCNNVSDCVNKKPLYIPKKEIVGRVIFFW